MAAGRARAGPGHGLHGIPPGSILSRPSPDDPRLGFVGLVRRPRRGEIREEGAAEVGRAAAHITEIAVGGQVAEQRRQLDLRSILVGKAGEARLALSGAPRASDPNHDIGVLRQAHAERIANIEEESRASISPAAAVKSP